MTAMQSIPQEAAAGEVSMPRFEDGSINLQELIRRLAEDAANEMMDAQADALCEATGNSRNGYRERTLLTCVGALTLRVPKLRKGSYFPDELLERYKRSDRALVAAVAEMYRSGVSTRKVERIAREMGVDRMSKDQVAGICAELDQEVSALEGCYLGGCRTPYVWLDATYVKCRRDRRVQSTAVVTAIGCDEEGFRHVLGMGVVDTESTDDWLEFLTGLRDRGLRGVMLVTSDAHGGLKNAVAEVFQGAAWQRCAVHLMRDCAKAARTKAMRAKVSKVVAPVFRAKDAATVRALYRKAVELLEEKCPKAAKVLAEAEPDALAYLDFPQDHWKRLRTNNVQERANREIKRRARVVQVFPSEASLNRLVGAVMAEMDEDWSRSRYFSEPKMALLHEPRKEEPEPSEEELAAIEKAAGAAVVGFWELAEALEAA